MDWKKQNILLFEETTMSEISYLPTIIIVIGILGFPYGFKLFCEAYVKGKKIQSSFMIMITKIECNLIKIKSFIKLQIIKEYQYIRIKIWVNRYFHKHISISNKKGEIETANELKKELKKINKFEREKFMKFADQFMECLAKMLQKTA